MPGITEPIVDEYMLSILPPRDSILQEMEAQAAKRDIPIVGPAVGRVLFQYARLINAKKVFELGSAIGYSTLWFARAVGEDGEVFYTDGDRKNADEASGYFRRAGVAERIHVGVGDALEQLSQRQREFGHTLAAFFIAVAAIMLVARLAGAAITRIGQPRVGAGVSRRGGGGRWPRR